jgi:type I restriction enzyme M protein
MGSQGDAGQFRTPRHIIDFLVAIVDPKKTDTILDPACGTAGFLISAFKHIKGNQAIVVQTGHALFH